MAGVEGEDGVGGSSSVGAEIGDESVEGVTIGGGESGAEDE